MSAEQQPQIHKVLHQRSSAIADAWYHVIRSSSPAPWSPAEIWQQVRDLVPQITDSLLAPCCDHHRIDAVATQLVSLRLPPRALGTLQQTLVQELVEGLSSTEKAALKIHPSELIGNLMASLLRGTREVILEQQEGIRGAYVEAIRQVQGEIRSKDAALQQQVERLQALQQIDRGILAASSPWEIANEALRQLTKLIPCRRASVALFDLQADRADVLAGAPPEAFDLSEAGSSFPLTGWRDVIDVLQREDIYVLEDVLRLPLPSPLHDRVRARTPHTYAIVPLHSEGELLGSLNLALEDPEVLTNERASIAMEVADSLAVAIHHAQLDASVARHREQLRLLTGRLAELDEEKRRTLARDLHDRIGQRLTALGINLNVIRASLDAERAPSLDARLDDSIRLLEETTDVVRQVMAELRPPMLDDYGLLPTLRWCGQQLASRTAVDVVVQGTEPDPRPPSPVEDALVRITQEALNNVAKHADASQVIVTLAERGDGIQLTISDDGAGFDPDLIDHWQTPRWGLLTMTERAEAVGGRCRVESQPGEGTRVVVKVTP